MSSKTIAFLPDPELREAFDAYMAAHGLTTSQAARVLVALALRGEASVDVTYRRAMIREGINLGLNSVKRRLGDVITQALGDMGDK